jgi:CPA1 family monovalent cation:H+ antiporter
MLNGLVFVLIGLQRPYVLAGIHGYGHATLVEYGAIFSGVLILLRLVWMFPGAVASAWIRRRVLKQRGSNLSRSEVFVLGWTGMRGVVALAAAISLPETMGNGQPFAQRNLIVFLTFSVILVTLVVQGLSLPAIVRALGLAGISGSDEEEIAARKTILKTVVQHLEQGLQSTADDTERHGFEDLLHAYNHRLSECGEDAQEQAAEARTMRKLGLEAVQVERQALIQLRDSGAIDDDVMRRLEMELDLNEAGRS